MKTPWQKREHTPVRKNTKHRPTVLKKLSVLTSIGLTLVLGACARTEIPATKDAQVLSPQATFSVNRRTDAPDARPGDGRCATAARTCTLRAAIQETNARPGADTVRLQEGTYTLTLGELEITDSLTLSGVNEDALIGSSRQTVIDAEGRSRVFFVDKVRSRPVVTLRGLTVRNGDERFSGYGAGVVISAGSVVTLERVIVRDNNARVFGAGISNFGVLTVRESTVYHNRMPTDGGGGVTNSGGGIYNSGILGLYDSTVYANEATRGGGIATDSSSATVIRNSTITSNMATGRGGGILNHDILIVISSTITRNEALAFGRPPGRGEDYFGGGVYNTGSVTLFGTILADNEANLDRRDPNSAPDCYSRSSGRTPSIRTFGANLVGVVNGNCNFPVLRSTSRPPDLLGTVASPASPMLFELTDDGGPTSTHALQPYSRAKDGAGVPSDGTFTCSSRDQRGARRPFDGNRDGSALCDIGAFESQEAPPRDTVAPTCQVDPSPARPAEEVRFTFQDSSGGSGLYRVMAVYENNVRVYGPYGFVSGTRFPVRTNVNRIDSARRAYILFIAEDAAGNRKLCGSVVPLG